MNFKPTKKKLMISIVIPIIIWVTNFLDGLDELSCLDCTTEIVQQQWFEWNMLTISISIGLAIIFYVVYSLVQKKEFNTNNITKKNNTNNTTKKNNTNNN